MSDVTKLAVKITETPSGPVAVMSMPGTVHSVFGGDLPDLVVKLRDAAVAKFNMAAEEAREFVDMVMAAHAAAKAAEVAAAAPASAKDV